MNAPATSSSPTENAMDEQQQDLTQQTQNRPKKKKSKKDKKDKKDKKKKRLRTAD
jgi:hypothetical protein